MGSWVYLWENGDVSFVSAATALDAITLLDQIGGASRERLKPVSEGFFFSFTPTKDIPKEDEWGWESDENSESVTCTLAELEKEARRRANIPDDILGPINLLHLLRQDIGSRGSLEDFDLKSALTNKLWKDEPSSWVERAVGLWEAHLKLMGRSINDIPRTGATLKELLKDVVDTQRSIIFGEKKGSV